MVYGLITHVAIRVENLVDAEEFYTELFATTVNYRQTPIKGEWHTLPEGVDWAEAEANGFEPRMSFIARDDFFLALAGPDEEWPGESVEEDYHIGVQMNETEFQDFLQRADELHCEILHQGEHDGSSYALVEDIYGYEWDIAVDWSTQRSAMPSGPWIDL